MKTLLIAFSFLMIGAGSLFALDEPICIAVILFDSSIVYAGPEDLIIVARPAADIPKFNADRFRLLLSIIITRGPVSSRRRVHFTGHEAFAMSYAQGVTDDMWISQYDESQGLDIGSGRLLREDGSGTFPFVLPAKFAELVLWGTDVLFFSLPFTDPDYDAAQGDSIALSLSEVDTCP